ncbi:hypothetical protein MVEN_01508200 [Mycena venus]|uniref:Uncharacterized protein n=1 Tax=Mycena venus TaxID=2733690 RepID=A0A8H6XSY3_9AGAR|nr:hypothetical protein MVEN_01508200 [Mycena venus]
MSAPVPESRALKLPAGAVGDLIKSLGKGILSGGAVTGLLSLLDGGDDSSDSSDAPRCARSLATTLEKLVGVGAESLESVLKKAIIGGAASGVAVEGVNAATGQSKRGIPAAVVDDAAKAAEKGLGSIIGNGVADGVGSALGGLGIGAIISKLFGNSDSSSSSTKRAFTDLTDEEVNTLLEYIGQMNSPSKRAISSSVGKGLAGVVAGLAATQGAESIIEEIKSLLRREGSLDELD